MYNIMTKPILTFCSNTIKHFKNIIKNNNTKSILIGVKGGGCNGFAYSIEPTNNPPKKYDENINIDNTDIIICGKSLLYLTGTHISWENNNLGSGLEFNNPNISSTCGCGSTFSL